MKVAVIGPRALTVTNRGDYPPYNTTEIISGGAKGVDTCARDYALSHGIVEVEPTVWKLLTCDEKEEIGRICEEKLEEYYRRFK